MNHFRNSTRLRLECLEDRTVPALLIQLDGSGNLTGIFGTPTGDVTLTVTNPDEIQIVDDAANLGTYSVPGNLNVSLGNSTLGPLVVLELNGNSLSGNVSMSVGNDVFGYGLFIDGPGTIGGNVNLFMGSSSLGFGQMGVAVGVFSSGLMEIGGNLTMTTTANIADVFLGFDPNGSNVNVGGNVTVRGGDEFGVGSANSTVGGNLTYVSSPAATTVGHQMRLEAGSVVNGNVSFTTSNAGSDDVAFEGTILGNAVLRMGTGGNVFNMVGTINGSLTITAGNSGSTIIFDPEAIVLGNVTIVTGNGVDLITLSGTVGGRSITVNAGSGADVVTVADLVAPGARLTAMLGNGADTLNFDAASSVVASAYLDGGNGADAFNALGTIAFPIVLRSF